MNKEEIIKDKLNKFAKIIEYKPDIDKDLDSVTSQKQEMGLVLLSRMKDILDETFDQAQAETKREILERLPEEIGDDTNKRKKLNILSPCQPTWDYCLREIKKIIKL